MARKILPLSLFLALLPSLLPAQSLLFKIGGGLSSHYGKDKSIGAYKIGVGYEWEFNQKWTFTPVLEVYGKGWKDRDTRVFVTDDSGNRVTDPATGEEKTGVMSRSATANYIELPLLFSYYVRTGEGRYIVFSAGPYLAYGLTGRQKTKGDAVQTGSEKLFYEKNTFRQSGTHRFDAGVQTMAGYQFPSSLILGIEADWGVTKFNTAGKRNVSALISLSYKLR